jgi:hypothetical protein
MQPDIGWQMHAHFLRQSGVALKRKSGKWEAFRWLASVRLSWSRVATRAERELSLGCIPSMSIIGGCKSLANHLQIPESAEHLSNVFCRQYLIFALGNPSAPASSQSHQVEHGMEYACTQCTHARTQRHRAHKPGIGPSLLPNSEFRVATTQILPVPSNVQLPKVAWLS